MQFVIIGGSDAGISAAIRARELDRDTRVTVMLADAYPNFSICGLPFYISGETPDWHSLAHRTEFAGITLLKDHFVERIEPAGRRLFYRAKSESQGEIAFDRLLIATGARPLQPAIPGMTLPGIYTLHTMTDSFRVHEQVAEEKPRSAVVVGSGYLGLEMADALRHRGMEVNLLGRSETVLPTVDREFGVAIENVLRKHGVRVESGSEVVSIEESGSELLVRSARETTSKGDMVIVATGVQPNAELALAAGIGTGESGAIKVNLRMQTNLPHIYAAGDCVETWHRVLNRYTYLPLGTTAHKQGRVAGENAVGGDREFCGSIGTQVVKVFDVVVGRTGLLDRDAAAAGFQPITIESSHFDHKAYYPGATRLRLRITGDNRTGRLLGAQILGPWRSEVSKRIDIFATALHHNMTIEELNDLDLSYTPPTGSPWDAVQMAAQDWLSAASKSKGK